jgi:hypothetical protein
MGVESISVAKKRERQGFPLKMPKQQCEPGLINGDERLVSTNICYTKIEKEKLLTDGISKAGWNREVKYKLETRSISDEL